MSYSISFSVGGRNLNSYLDISNHALHIILIDGTAREDIQDYETMDAGDSGEPGPQRCK